MSSAEYAREALAKALFQYDDMQTAFKTNYQGRETDIANLVIKFNAQESALETANDNVISQLNGDLIAYRDASKDTAQSAKAEILKLFENFETKKAIVADWSEKN